MNKVSRIAMKVKVYILINWKTLFTEEKVLLMHDLQNHIYEQVFAYLFYNHYLGEER